MMLSKSFAAQAGLSRAGAGRFPAQLMSVSSFPRSSEALPADFLAHLEERLGLAAGEVALTLADWVTSYQPGPIARAQAVRVPALLQ